MALFSNTCENYHCLLHLFLYFLRWRIKTSPFYNFLHLKIIFKCYLIYLSGPASDDSVEKAKTIVFICIFFAILLLLKKYLDFLLYYCLKHSLEKVSQLEFVSKEHIMPTFLSFFFSF